MGAEIEWLRQAPDAELSSLFNKSAALLEKTPEFYGKCQSSLSSRFVIEALSGEGPRRISISKLLSVVGVTKVIYACKLRLMPLAAA